MTIGRDPLSFREIASLGPPVSHTPNAAKLRDGHSDMRSPRDGDEDMILFATIPPASRDINGVGRPRCTHTSPFHSSRLILRWCAPPTSVLTILNPCCFKSAASEDIVLRDIEYDLIFVVFCFFFCWWLCVVFFFCCFVFLWWVC